MSILRGVRVALLALALLPMAAGAQGRGSVTGQVVDAATQQPLANVQVYVAGTTRGSLTNEQGKFTLADVPAGQLSVVASRLGYAQAIRPASVVAGQAASVSFQLAATVVALDELVVTGTTGRSRRAEQPAVIGSVAAGELVEQGAASVAELLTGRIPGVALSPTSGVTGAAQQIRIRGAASISLSNEPLVFIDGVRADSRVYGAREAQTAEFSFGFGGQGTSRLNDINPEDIESIEVVKGPAAATLYGADASAGVIQIITKKGRAGQNRFSQTVSAEYGQITPGFTPAANYGACTAALVAPTSPSELCRGQAVGTIVSDNPLLRAGLLRDGEARSFSYSARGGGESYGYYLSLGLDGEEGTLPNSSLERRTGRANFRFAPTPALSVDAGLGLYRTAGELPLGDSHGLGFLPAAYIGSPATVGAAAGGFGSPHPQSGLMVDSELATTRYTPTLQVEYAPLDWMTHRLIVGADLSRSDGEIFFPRNTEGYFGTTDNAGTLLQNRNAFDVYTFDYLGTLRAELGADVRSDLAFGVQAIADRTDAITGWGNGYVANTTRLVGAAARTQLVQSYAENRSLGFLGQLNVALRERLFLQLGARVDQHSAFGADVKPFFLPKVGVAYNVSDEPFWAGLGEVVPTLRLRAAYGTTGRAPLTGAALQTFAPYPYALAGDTLAQPGVVPLNPGNFDLRPEKGTELEAGLDASFLDDRLAVEVTYFRKTTTDLLLERPIAPSAGYVQGAGASPWVNIGEVLNQGVEYSVRGQLVRSAAFGWEAWVAGSTLQNELVDLGGIAPFGTSFRFEEGQPLSAMFARRVLSVDETARRAVVTDANEYVGSVFPSHEGHVGSAFSYGALRLSGQLDWKAGFKVFNNTANTRERGFRNSELFVDTTALSVEQRLRRYGPFVTAAGTAVTATAVNEAYMEDGDFLRFRELAATLTLPASLAGRFGAGSASFTLSGHNLGLWTKYSGGDPEVLARALSSATAAGTFQREDMFSMPQARRWVARVNFTF